MAKVTINFGVQRMEGKMGVSVKNENYKFRTEILDQCLRAKVPFFFKQLGGVQKKRAGRTLEGRTWDEMPVSMNLVKA